MSGLLAKSCVACEGGVKPLGIEEKQNLIAQIDSRWRFDENHRSIVREFDFKNYYHTMAFVNAVAWISHQEKHHPDLTVSYNACTVNYTTHAMEDVTENDFICAAKIDQLTV